MTDDGAAAKSRAVVVALRQALRDRDRAAVRVHAEWLRSDLLGRLRQFVWHGHPNEGKDIIDEALHDLMTALLDLGSADGAALENAFVTTVRYRALTAIGRSTLLHARELPYDTDDSGEILLPKGTAGADGGVTPWLIDPLAEMMSVQEIEALLAKVKDVHKRLAFRLHMEGDSMPEIGLALSVDRKTAKAWVRQVRGFLEREIRRRGGI